MDHFQNSSDDQKKMLQTIGIRSMDELFGAVPAEFRLKRTLNIPAADSEASLFGAMRATAAKNLSAEEAVCFVGGGHYDHFIPSIIDPLSSRGEFLTSYTPYQPEISQGNLQAMFEFQSMICELTGMEISCTSIYDGSTAFVEGVLMGLRLNNKRSKIVLSSAVHPHYRETVKTYLVNLNATLVETPYKNGVTDMDALKTAVDDQTALVGITSPSFFGHIEDIKAIADLAKSRGALLLVACDPVCLAILKSPGEAGADIAVGEGQPLGNPLNYGGPSLGFFTSRMEHSRQMPGRIVGETLDTNGKRGFVLTMQTREQHIRREKATSNICTSSELMVLRATMFLETLGANGLRSIAEASAKKAHYLAEKIAAVKGYRMKFSSPFAREFVVECPTNGETVINKLLDHKILGGLALGRWYPELQNCIQVAVTEKRTFAELDCFAQTLAKL